MVVLVLLLVLGSGRAMAADLDYEGGSARHLLRVLAREMGLRAVMFGPEVPWDATVTLRYSGPPDQGVREVLARVRSDLEWRVQGDRLLVGVPGTDFFEYPPPPAHGGTARFLLGEQTSCEAVADFLGWQFPDLEVWTEEDWNEVDVRGDAQRIREVKNTFHCSGGTDRGFAVVRRGPGLDTTGLEGVEVHFSPRYNLYLVSGLDSQQVEQAAAILRSR